MLRIKIKPEHERFYREFDPEIWYEVAYTVLDRYVLANGVPYFKSKFDVEEVSDA